MDEGLKSRYESVAGAAAYRRKYERTWLRRISHRREMRLVRRAMEVAGTRGEVLDVPCAAGRLVPTLLERAERVTAVDLSPTMIAQARDALRAQEEAGRVALWTGSADALPFGEGAFDTAFCWRFLHHLTERGRRVAVLKEMRRVARRAVVVSFADGGTLRARWQRLRRRNRRCAKRTAADLAAEAAEAGLRVEYTMRLSSAFSLLAAAVLIPVASGAGHRAETPPAKEGMD